DELLIPSLAARGVGMSASLGFEDRYALGMKGDHAAQLGVSRLSDLLAHPELRLVFSEEFLHRPDGWPAVQACYGLPQTEARPLDHDLSYRALASGSIDAMDLYTTDAEIERQRIRVLDDDRRCLTRYRAVLLYRADLPARVPDAWTALAG